MITIIIIKWLIESNAKANLTQHIYYLILIVNNILKSLYTLYNFRYEVSANTPPVAWKNRYYGPSPRSEPRGPNRSRWKTRTIGGKKTEERAKYSLRMVQGPNADGDIR